MGKAFVRAVCAVAVFGMGGSAYGDDVTDLDRFQLWNHCLPMGLEVSNRSSDSGLSDEAIETTFRSRLRAARLYVTFDNRPSSYLFVDVYGGDFAFTVRTQYRKFLFDSMSYQNGWATTWHGSWTGTEKYAGDAKSFISQAVDEFIDEYLRVNADACE